MPSPAAAQVRRSFLSALHRGARCVHGKSWQATSDLSSTEVGILSGEAVGAVATRGNLELLSRIGFSDTLVDSGVLSEWRRDVHGRAQIDGAGLNPSLLEKLVVRYTASGQAERARRIFDRMPQPNVFLWNTMIRAYAWHGPFHQAVELFRRMLSSGLAPNKFTFPSVLKACSALLALEGGVEIHGRVVRMGMHSDVFICTALVDMYVKCGRIDKSCLLFEKMSRRDIVAWNAIIAGSALHGMNAKCVDLLLKMQRAGVTPNPSTLVALLPAIGGMKVLRPGMSVHAFCIRRNFEEIDVFVGTALLDMYAKCDHLAYARKVFDKMPLRNEVSWSAMIGACNSCDRMIESLEAFKEMIVGDSCQPTPSVLATILCACARLIDLNKGCQAHGYLIKSGFSSHVTVANSLLSMYAKCGNIDDAVDFFGEMETKDTVSYSAVISGCLQNGSAQEALHIFRKMQTSNTQPDASTMVGLIPACSHLAALQHGRCSHGYVIVRGFSSDVSICNALIDMYAKCGRINLARIIFDSMLIRNIISWNTIISGYGIHGLGKEALSLFYDLQTTGLEPDDVTFIGLLSACSHSGLVKEGKELFSSMTESFNIAPRIEHCICVVDLLGRCGHLNEAQNFIRQMPFAADARIWGALLGACRLHKNVELAEQVSRIIQILGLEDSGNIVLLSNIYSAAGKFDEAANIRVLQKHWGFKKSPGCSWIEISGRVHAFIGEDRTHPSSMEIYQKLEELFVEMKKWGYEADTSYVLQNVEGEEKERLLLYHSEKLAIAFGILRLNVGQPIFVSKNLRVCGDCHSAIKFISLITKREISLRDTNRFHHFMDGNCSCGDFW